MSATTTVRSEWLIRYANGILHNEDEPFADEASALKALTQLRKGLDAYGVPEEFLPILVRREIETVVTVGSWEVLYV